MIYKSIKIEKAEPRYTFVNSNTNRIYISYTTSDFILTVNLSDGSIEDKVPANMPGNIVLNNVTNKVYVSSGQGIVEIDGINNHYNVINIGLPHSGGSVYVNPLTNLLYTTCFGHDILSVIDPAKQAIDDKIPVEKSPKGVAVDSIRNKIYVANRESNSISIIDSKSKKLIDSIDLRSSRSEYGAWPEIIIANTESNLLYVQRSGVLSAGGGGTTLTDLLVIDTIKKSITNERQIHTGPPLEKATFAFNNSNSRLHLTNFSVRNGYAVLILDAFAKEVLQTSHLKTKWWNRFLSIWGWVSEPISINTLTNKVYVTDSSNKILYELNV